jgi:hypothetical protein
VTGFSLTAPTSAYIPSPSIYVVFCFFLAVLLLDSFDISLPRGDSIGVSGAVSAAAILLLGPAWAMVICIGSALVTHLARHGAESRRRVIGALLARSCALLAGVLTSRALSFLAISPRGAGYYGLFAATLVPAAFLLTDLVTAQYVAAVGTGRPFSRLLRGNLRVQAPLLVAQWSASVLLLITYAGIGPWSLEPRISTGMGAYSLIPVVALLFLMRQSYAMLQDIRELYRTTVEVLVEAAEAQDDRRIGHAERTASVARVIATRMGLASIQVERISYAALLHDVDAIGSPAELSTLEDGQKHDPMAGTPSPVFEGVRFFSDVVPIIRVCDGDWVDEAYPAEADLLAGLIVALASDADAAMHSCVAEAHVGNSIDRVAPHATASMKASVVGAALASGYRIPAVR